MDPKVTHFFLFNGFVVLVIVAYLLWRPKRTPSRLKLRDPHALDKPQRQLNAIFQFNGHDFDAYEVLGLPAGTPFATVEASYQKLLKSEPADTHEFYKMAYRAIQRQS